MPVQVVLHCVPQSSRSASEDISGAWCLSGISAAAVTANTMTLSTCLLHTQHNLSRGHLVLVEAAVKFAYTCQTTVHGQHAMDMQLSSHRCLDAPDVVAANTRRPRAALRRLAASVICRMELRASSSWFHQVRKRSTRAATLSRTHLHIALHCGHIPKL